METRQVSYDVSLARSEPLVVLSCNDKPPSAVSCTLRRSERIPCSQRRLMNGEIHEL